MVNEPPGSSVCTEESLRYLGGDEISIMFEFSQKNSPSKLECHER
jgi:hypothetical protein